MHPSVWRRSSSAFLSTERSSPLPLLHGLARRGRCMLPPADHLTCQSWGVSCAPSSRAPGPQSARSSIGEPQPKCPTSRTRTHRALIAKARGGRTASYSVPHTARLSHTRIRSTRCGARWSASERTTTTDPRDLLEGLLKEESNESLTGTNKTFSRPLGSGVPGVLPGCAEVGFRNAY